MVSEGKRRLSAYIMGVWHGIEDTDALLHLPRGKRPQDYVANPQDDPPKTVVCVPPNVKVWAITETVINMMVPLLKLYPGDRDQPADSLVFAALTKAYPCKR